MILILNKLHTPAADTTTSALDRASISSSLGVYRWQIVVVRSNPPLIKEFFKTFCFASTLGLLALSLYRGKKPQAKTKHCRILKILYL